MTRTSQKADERWAAERYLALRGITGSLIDGPEPPDFLLSIDGALIAIEVTEYHRPRVAGQRHSRREVEAAWERFVDWTSERRTGTDNLSRLSVHLEFREARLPPPKAWPEFFAAICGVINSVRSALTEEFVHIKFDHSHPPLLVEYLARMRLRPVRAYLDWNWNFSAGGIGTSDEELCEVVRAKCGRDGDPDQYSDYWLIISGGGARLSQIAAPISAAQLMSFSQLAELLNRSRFSCVAMLDIRDFHWQRGLGWAALRNAP